MIRNRRPNTLRIAEFIAQNSDLSANEIAKLLDVSYSTVFNVAKRTGLPIKKTKEGNNKGKKQQVAESAYYSHRTLPAFIWP